MTVVLDASPPTCRVRDDGGSYRVPVSDLTGVPPGATITFPSLTLSSPVTIPAGVTVEGESSSSTVDGGALAAIFLVTGDDVTVRDITLTADAPTTVAIRATSCSGLTVRGVKAVTCALVDTNVSVAYADAGAGVGYCSRLTVGDNVCVNAADTTGSDAAIHVCYTTGATITGNTITGYRHGIGYWGGDSNHNADGAVANARKCTDLTISTNVITDVAMGGIWGSMGERVAIHGNTVTGCGDVGIDVEGTFGATVQGNVVTDCTYGCVAMFFYNRSVAVTGNTLRTDTADQWLFAVHNSGGSTDNQDVMFQGNICEAVGVIARAGKDNAETIKVNGNTFRNVILQFSANNYRYVTVDGNTFTFTQAAPSPINAIQVQATNYGGRARIASNQVISTVSQPAGSIGIYVEQTDYNATPVTVIDGNLTRNFPADIKVLANSANAGITPVFHIARNSVGASSIIRAEGATAKSAVLLTGNHTPALAPYPSAQPGSGKWDTGQAVEAPDPGATGFMGWVCTAGGTPGTWTTFGPVT